MNEHYKVKSQTLVDVADKIRNYTGTIELVKPENLDTKVDNVYEAGKQAEYDAFWDATQDYGKRTAYVYAFGSYIWNDTNFKPKYDIKPIGNCTNIFRYVQVTDFVSILEKQGVVLDLSGATNLEYAFQSCTTKRLGVIDCTGIPSSSVLRSAFNSMPNIETIELLRVNETLQYSGTFNNSPQLVNLTIEGVIGQNGFNVSWSTLLSHDSLMSIINALQDKTGDTSGTSWIVTLGTTNLAKLSDAEKAIATEKGWSLA